MFSFNNGPANGRKYEIYDDRFGSRFFDTEAERDEYYSKAQWIDQKHWYKREL